MRETKQEIMSGVADAARAKFIAPNTVEYYRSDGTRVIRLHQTDILSWSPDGRTVTLDTGGWRTVTTKERINRYLGQLRVYSDRGLWHLYGPWNYDWSSRERVPFFDGIQVTDGRLPKAKPAVGKKNARLRDQILKFCRRLDGVEKLPEPSPGDCFLCQMSASATHIDIGGHQATQYLSSRDARVRPAQRDINPDHLRSHLKEGYLHGSLLVNAMRWAGWPDTRIGLWYYYIGRGERGYHLKDVKNVLRRYLRAQLGL